MLPDLIFSSYVAYYSYVWVLYSSPKRLETREVLVQEIYARVLTIQNPKSNIISKNTITYISFLLVL